MLDDSFNPTWFAQQIGEEGEGGPWDVVRTSAFLEADSDDAEPFTGSQFTNDDVYRHGFLGEDRDGGQQTALGIQHFVEVRYQDVRQQLTGWRDCESSGVSGESFPQTPEDLPELDEGQGD